MQGIWADVGVYGSIWSIWGYMEVYSGIWMYMVYIWRYMEVYEGISVTFMCNLVSENKLCDSTCDMITLTTPASKGRLDISPHVETTGWFPDVSMKHLPLACGTYKNNGQLVEFEEGVPFNEYCSGTCAV